MMRLCVIVEAPTRDLRRGLCTSTDGGRIPLTRCACFHRYASRTVCPDAFRKESLRAAKYFHFRTLDITLKKIRNKPRPRKIVKGCRVHLNGGRRSHGH